MNVYRYTALSASGERLAGSISGATEQAALMELERQDLTPVELHLDQRATTSAAAGDGVRVGSAPLAEAYLQISELLEAGVPLLRSLRLIAARKSRPKLGRIVGELADQVEDGEDLAESMARRPAVFRPVHVAMIRAGEKGGFLESSLRQLGEFIRAQVEMRQKLIDNMIYPAVILVVLILGLGVLFIFFVPMFKDLFIDQDLPATTEAIFAISAAVTEYGAATAIATILLCGGAWWAWRQPQVRDRAGDLAAALPVLGGLVRGLGVARFCRVLGTLLGNGVGLLAALEIARDAAGLAMLHRAIEEATDAVRGGDSLADPLGESGLFDDEVIEMIRVGESANNLGPVLVRVADSHDAAIERLLARLTKLIEPFMIVCIGVVVLFVAMSLILPMLNMTSDL